MSPPNHYPTTLATLPRPAQHHHPDSATNMIAKAVKSAKANCLLQFHQLQEEVEEYERSLAATASASQQCSAVQPAVPVKPAAQVVFEKCIIDMNVLDGNSSVNANHIDMSKLSNWICGNKDCQKKIPQAVVDGYLLRSVSRFVVVCE